jgi:hypothetical protein
VIGYDAVGRPTTQWRYVPNGKGYKRKYPDEMVFGFRQVERLVFLVSGKVQ